MERRINFQGILAATVLAVAVMVFGATLVHAQTASQNQLRSTIYTEIMADPRSQTMTQAQIYSLVNALSNQAQQQGITNAQLTYRPQSPFEPASAAAGSCTNISCSIARAFGLDGSFPIIPLALFVAAALFILIYSIMREMGHPHAKA